MQVGCHAVTKQLWRASLRQRPVPQETISPAARRVDVCILSPLISTDNLTAKNLWEALLFTKKELLSEVGTLPPADQVDLMKDLPLILILANCRAAHQTSQRVSEELQEGINAMLTTWLAFYETWDEPAGKESVNSRLTASFQTSLSTFTIRFLKEFAEKCTERDLDFMLSCGTPNEVDTGTYIFITPVTTMIRTAAAISSEPSTSQSTKRTRIQSPEECLLDTTEGFGNNQFFTAEALPQKTSGGGCSISVKRPEGTYTWKSEAWKHGTYFLDLKVYSDVKAYKTATWKDQWKLADLRVKTTIGSPMEMSVNKKVRQLLDQLTNLLLEEAENYPQIEKKLLPK